MRRKTLEKREGSFAGMIRMECVVYQCARCGVRNLVDMPRASLFLNRLLKLRAQPLRARRSSDGRSLNRQ